MTAITDAPPAKDIFVAGRRRLRSSQCDERRPDFLATIVRAVFSKLTYSSKGQRSEWNVGAPEMTFRK